MSWRPLGNGDYIHSSFPATLDRNGNLFFLREDYRSDALPVADLFENPVSPAVSAPALESKLVAGSGITLTNLGSQLEISSAGGGGGSPVLLQSASPSGVSSVSFNGLSGSMFPLRLIFYFYASWSAWAMRINNSSSPSYNCFHRSFGGAFWSAYNQTMFNSNIWGASFGWIDIGFDGGRYYIFANVCIGGDTPYSAGGDFAGAPLDSLQFMTHSGVNFGSGAKIELWGMG